jgi:type I restriction enzyme M protein
MVPVSEISDAKNDYNLNLPRYIDGSDAEDLQDITAHLRGGIPERDIDAFDAYWRVMPSLRKALFTGTDKVNIFNLAKNAGTSVEQIERFYARHLPLSKEMARNLQSFGGD